MLVTNSDGYLYIPITIIQAELMLIYEGYTKWEMLRDVVTEKGVWGVGKLHYRLPFGDQEWLFQTGTASIPITKRLRLSYPSLEVHCILNAAKKIGPWFGQNLNRDKEELDEETEIPIVNKATERLEVLIENAKTIEDLGKLKEDCKKNPEANILYMKKLKNFV